MAQANQRGHLHMPDEIVILWIPSHCNIDENDHGDMLANERTEMNQENFPVIHQIMNNQSKVNKPAFQWFVEQREFTKVKICEIKMRYLQSLILKMVKIQI